MTQPTLTITIGVPGSGKSTWAAKQTAKDPSIRIINKDDIRKELTVKGWTWTHENERDVIQLRDTRIAEALNAGFSVISSDCNFGKHKLALRELARQCNALFRVRFFTDVSLETCIERDAKRTEGKVGADVITRMYNQHVAILPKSIPYVPDVSKNPAIICDLDGTLALFTGLRGPYDYDKCANDRVNDPILRIISLFSKAGYSIVYCSGRDDSCRFQTEDFLSTNGCPKGPLFMRTTGDNRKDSIIKQELFDTHIRDNYNVKFVLDDRDQVVKMWRSLGLTCLQVAEGNF